MSTQETGGGLTKWQIAALIGAPVAVACVLGAFYYWKSSHSAVEDQEGTENDTTSKQSDAPANEAPDSEDVSEQEQVHWVEVVKLSFKLEKCPVIYVPGASLTYPSTLIDRLDQPRAWHLRMQILLSCLILFLLIVFWMKGLATKYRANLLFGSVV